MEITNRYLERDSSFQVLGIQGMTYYMRKQYPESLRIFERMRALGDSTYSTNFYLGLNYLETDLLKALYAFEDAYKADSTNIEGVYQYACILGRVTRRDSLTRSMFDKAIGMMQPDPKVMYRFTRHTGTGCSGRNVSRRRVTDTWMPGATCRSS